MWQRRACHQAALHSIFHISVCRCMAVVRLECDIGKGFLQNLPSPLELVIFVRLVLSYMKRAFISLVAPASPPFPSCPRQNTLFSRLGSSHHRRTMTMDIGRYSLRAARASIGGVGDDDDRLVIDQVCTLRTVYICLLFTNKGPNIPEFRQH